MSHCHNILQHSPWCYTGQRWGCCWSCGIYGDVCVCLYGPCVWVTFVPSCAKLKRVPEGEVRLDPGENGELLAESCRPLVEWERSQSRASSWLLSWGGGPYLRDIYIHTVIRTVLSVHEVGQISEVKGDQMRLAENRDDVWMTSVGGGAWWPIKLHYWPIIGIPKASCH